MKNIEQRSNLVLTVDCVVFGYADSTLQVALIKRKKEPFKNYWALPGGFLEGNETVEEAAYRELAEETGINQLYLEQFHVFSHPERDPRGHIVTVGFFALINSEALLLTATQDALEAEWFNAYKLPTLGFDHHVIFQKALLSLRRSVQLDPIIFELLPAYFSLSMLQTLYEQIFNTTVDKRNFRKKILSMPYIQETQRMTQQAKHRPARLYTFSKTLFQKHHYKPFSL